jgi:response regulator RpfG family c-di-GMP phosphodiesterase
MELNEEDSQNLLFAALLHDIGKVGLPDELLAKPFSMLPAQERAQVARHTVIGEGLLMGLAPLQEAARLIRSHHERHDGKGYPDRLTGAHIPLGARILAVANDYDALQIGTLARQRMSPVEAAKFIRENRGKRYDPEVTEAFIHFLKHGVPTKKTTGAMAMRASELLPGMVLARDLTMRDKLLLLSEGFHLNETLIQKIRVFERSVGEELQIFVREHTQAG